MRVWCDSFIDVATKKICDKYDSYAMDYINKEEVINFLWEDLKSYDGIQYRLFIGALLINYVEVNLFFLSDKEMKDEIEKLDPENMESLFEDDPDLLYEIIECTLEKEEMNKEEREQCYQILMNSEFANIYSRFDPKFEADRAIHDNNYPTDPIKKVDSNFYDTYFYLKNCLDYEEHIFYILKDLIQNKYTKEESDNLLKSLSTSFYFYTKGKTLLNDESITSIEKELLNQLETAGDETECVSLLQNHDTYLSLVIEKCCFYQEHLFDEEQVEVHHKAEKLQYMKRFTAKKRKVINKITFLFTCFLD